MLLRVDEILNADEMVLTTARKKEEKRDGL